MLPGSTYKSIFQFYLFLNVSRVNVARLAHSVSTLCHGLVNVSQVPLPRIQIIVSPAFFSETHGAPKSVPYMNNDLSDSYKPFMIDSRLLFARTVTPHEGRHHWLTSRVITNSTLCTLNRASSPR